MKLLEHEARNIFAEYGIPVPKGEVIRSPGELGAVMEKLGDRFVLKAQVEVGGRGKKGGVVVADRSNGVERASSLFCRDIGGIPVKEVLAVEYLESSTSTTSRSRSTGPGNAPSSSFRRRAG